MHAGLPEREPSGGCQLHHPGDGCGGEQPMGAHHRYLSAAERRLPKPAGGTTAEDRALPGWKPGKAGVNWS